MSDPTIVFVPGVCAGHPEHPELLWVFETQPSGLLKFSRIEIDFPEPAEEYSSNIKVFDVNMEGFDHCPYCEAELYFFCKRCHHLSCFNWTQVDESNKWTCYHCLSQYRMKLKTTPFRVAAQVGNDSSGRSPSDTQMGSSVTPHLATPSGNGSGNTQVTQMWHPKNK